MRDERLIVLLDAYLDGSLTLDEKQELERMLLESDAARRGEDAETECGPGSAEEAAADGTVKRIGGGAWRARRDRRNP